MNVLRLLVAASALFVGAAAAPALAAPSVGDTVTCASNLFTCSTASATVGAGTEFTLDPGIGNALFYADFSDGMLTFSRNTGSQVGFAGQRLVFTDPTAPITAASIASSSGVSNFDNSNLSIANGRLTLFFGRQVGNGVTTSDFASGASLQILLGSAVPEPASWAMLILGMGAIGQVLRRRVRASEARFDARIKRIAAGEIV